MADSQKRGSTPDAHGDMPAKKRMKIWQPAMWRALEMADTIPEPYNIDRLDEIRALSQAVCGLTQEERSVFARERKSLWVAMVSLSCWEYLKQPLFPTSGRWVLPPGSTRLGHVTLSNWGIVASLNIPSCDMCRRLGETCQNTAGSKSSSKCRQCLFHHRTCSLHDARTYKGPGIKPIYQSDEERRQAHNRIHRDSMDKFGGPSLIRKEQMRRKALREQGFDIGPTTYRAIYEAAKQENPDLYKPSEPIGVSTSPPAPQHLPSLPIPSQPESTPPPEPLQLELAAPVPSRCPSLLPELNIPVPPRPPSLLPDHTSPLQPQCPSPLSELDSPVVFRSPSPLPERTTPTTPPQIGPPSTPISSGLNANTRQFRVPTPTPSVRFIHKLSSQICGSVHECYLHT